MSMISADDSLEDGEIYPMNEHIEFEIDANDFAPTFISNLIEQIRNNVEEVSSELIKIDSLSGAATRKPTITLSNGKLYEISFLSDYILQMGDHRDPHSGFKFTREDLKALSEASLIDSERIRDASENALLPKSSKTSAIKFFEDSIEVASIQMLASCELTSISTLQELQENYETLWSTILKCLCGLVTLNPLSAITSASKLQSAFSTALASCEDQTSYVYEQTAILPISTAIHALATSIGQGVLKSKTSDILRQIQNARTVRLLF